MWEVDGSVRFSDSYQAQVNKANIVMNVVRRTYSYLDEEPFKYLFQAWSNHIRNMLLVFGTPT